MAAQACTGFTSEVSTKLQASRIYAAISDLHTLAPLLAPEMVKSVDLLEGDGGAGTLLQYNYTPALPYAYAKERVDVFDKEAYEYQYTVTEGAELGTKYNSAVYKFKLTPTAEGGAVCSMSAQYGLIPGVEFPEDEVNRHRDEVIAVLKGLEEYLLATPDAYAAA